MSGSLEGFHDTKKIELTSEGEFITHIGGDFFDSEPKRKVQMDAPPIVF